MDFAKLHTPYKDANSPSVEVQIKWLRKYGFPDHIIDQTMISVYTAIEQGKRTFRNGGELNLYLREEAKKIQNAELSAYVAKLEEFESKMRKKWEAEIPWWKRYLGFKK